MKRNTTRLALLSSLGLSIKDAWQRLSVALMLVMLTVQTAWADETLTFTFYYDSERYSSYIVYGGTNYKMNNDDSSIGWHSTSVTVGDVTVTSDYGSDHTGWVVLMSNSMSAYEQGYRYELNADDASTLTFSSNKYISHVTVYCTEKSRNWTLEVDNNTKSCSVNLNKSNHAYKVDVTISDNTPTHYYDITYELNGGENNNGNPTQYEMSAGVALFYDATRTGYTFNGWFSNSGLTDAITSIPANSTGAKTLYAGWTINQYTLSFNTNGGTPATIAAITQDYGTDITAPADPSRTGYTFAGWNPALPTTMPAASSTHTANWTRDEYTINYELNGGTVATANPVTYNVETETFTLNNPTRTDYTFTGWTGSNGSTPQTTVTIAKGSTTGTLNYTANWTPTDYAINYELNGGELPSGQSNPATYNIETNTFTLINPSRTGYTFAGWTGSNGTTPEMTVTIMTGSKTGALNYTANWTVNQYTITFDTGTGGTAIAPITQDYDTNITAPANPTRPGYTFTGWDKTIPTKMPAENMTITAQWAIITYSITYDLASGELPSGQNNPTTYTVETETFTLINPNPTQSSCYFNGWTGSNGTAPETTVTIAQGSTGDKNYTANWSSYQYVITYNLNGGAFYPGVTVPDGYNVSTEDVVINEGPIRDGYTFDGWTGTGIDSPEHSITIPAGATGNRSYTAQWTLTSYNIIYYLNGGTNAAGNPTSYNIESATFTINPPTREGYTFLGWTGWTYSTPQTTITIPTGTMGIMEFTAQWSKDYSSIWSHGAGTENNPYIISSTTDLDQLATLVNAGENFYDTYFKLGSDITYDPNMLTVDSDEDGIMDSNYKAIGYKDEHWDEQTHINIGNIRNFSGTFDGDGHTISGIRIGRGGNTLYDDNQGLFGRATGGSIKNVTLADADITGRICVGGIAGYSASNIENCHVKSDVFLRTVQNGATAHGGIAGNNEGVTISHCTSAAQLTMANGLTGCMCYGGIAGNARGYISNNLVVGATVPAVGQYYGAIGGTDAEAQYKNGVLGVNNFSNISNNYYTNCTVGGVTTNVGFGYMYENYDEDYNPLESSPRVTDWTENDGAVNISSSNILSESASVPSTLSGTVVFRRTFTGSATGGTASTVCLPFTFEKPDKSAVGTFYTFGGVDYNTTSQKWEATMNEVPDATTTLSANTPYMFKPAGTDAHQPVLFHGTAAYDGTQSLATSGEVANWEFHGTYVRKDWTAMGKDYGFAATAATGTNGEDIKAGDFVRFAAGAWLVPMRCYLTYTGETAPARGIAGKVPVGDLPTTISVKLVAANGITTEIGTLDTRTGEVTFGDEWYSLDGRKLNGKPTKQGLYINNGKKVVIKN